MIQRFLLLVISLNFFTSCATTVDCHLTLDDFEEITTELEYRQWYDDFKVCKNSPNVSSDVLFQLYLAIGWAELDGYPANRPKNLYDLVYRSAVLGNQEALIEMAGFYLHGTEILKIDQSDDVYNCFHNLADAAPDGDADFSAPVANCLALAD